MKSYPRSHLTDPALLSGCATHRDQTQTSMAELLADIAEIDARRLFVPAGYPSLYAWCVGELRLSEDCVLKHIQAARAARQFPAILPALAESRLHVTGVCLLAPYLQEGTADDLLAAAMGKTKTEIKRLLAERFPRSEMLAMVEPLPDGQHAPAHVGASEPDVGAWAGQHAPAHVDAAAPRTQVAPLARERYSLTFAIGQSTYDNLQYAQALASHQIPSGDVAEVFDRAIQAFVRELEKTKFAATSRPRPGQPRVAAGSRHIPAHVKRTVWERDCGQCTFVSESGHRCAARKLLQFDHIDPVACGGQATVERMRLRCHAHNQYEAEQMFGVGFMNQKREEAQGARQAVMQKRGAESDAPAHVAEVIPWLRQLGFRAAEARSAAALCEPIPDASLEQRIKVALSYFAKARSAPAAVPGASAQPSVPQAAESAA